MLPPVMRRPHGCTRVDHQRGANDQNTVRGQSVAHGLFHNCRRHVLPEEDNCGLLEKWRREATKRRGTQYETWTNKKKKNRTGNGRQHCGGGGVPQCQHGRRCTRARKTGSGRGRARLHHHLALCLQLLRLTLRTRRKRQQRQARCTPAAREYAYQWHWNGEGAASLMRRRRRRSGWYLLGATGAGVPATTGEDAAAFASGSQSGLAASRRAWK
jgi:hypothetical protein